MRKDKYLHKARYIWTLLMKWCLIGTTLLSVQTVEAVTSDEELILYDSSLQRSNFLSIDPQYQGILLEQIKNRRAVFLWKFRFDSQSLSTENNINSQNVGATVRGKFNYKLVDDLQFHAKVNLSLESGRSQDVFGDLEPSSGIYPRELKLQYRPFGDLFILDFGQLHQKWLNQPLFLGNLGFPGVKQTLGYANKRFAIDLVAQQLIPTSATLSTRVTEREETPTLTTETLQATYQISSLNFVKGRFTHYRYQNLPAIVAFESGIYGNSIGGFDQKNSFFEFEFDGFMTQLAFEQKISDSLSAQVQWDTIKNNEAPDSLGEAQSIRAWLANDFGRWIVAASYMNYFIEGDAVPAYYNSYRLGHNNRIGNAFELNLESKDWGVIFRGVYTEADLLRPSARRALDGLQQDNQQTIYFAVETMYDFI